MGNNISYIFIPLLGILYIIPWELVWNLGVKYTILIITKNIAFIIKSPLTARSKSINILKNKWIKALMRRSTYTLELKRGDDGGNSP